MITVALIDDHLIVRSGFAQLLLLPFLNAQTPREA